MSDGPTPRQQQVLTVLADYAHGATVRQLVDRLDHPAAGGQRWGYTRVYAALKSLDVVHGVVSSRQERQHGVRVNVYSLVPGA